MPVSFADLQLHEDLLEGIGYMGFKEATPIQEQVIPAIIEGQDILACAQTGTGKTAAFMLPVLSQMAKNAPKGTQTLVVVPTRELALQIDQQIQGFSYFINVRSMAIYGGGGGDDWEEQKKALKEGVGVVVATPGKLIAHLKMGYVNFDTVQYLILDEADRMLDMGFSDDLEEIVSHLPKKRQNLMFSATMPKKIADLAHKILVKPKEVKIAISKPAEGVLQAAYVCYDEQKIPLLNQLIADNPKYESIIVFSSTKKNVFNIVRGLRKGGHDPMPFSSEYTQQEREDVLRSFRSKATRIVVATDVLSRGIDIKDINLVVNFDVPNDAEDYVHRVGRTARASTTGVALTFVNPKDMYSFHQIETLIESEIYKAPLDPSLGEVPEWNPKAKSKKKKYYKRKKKRK